MTSSEAPSTVPPEAGTEPAPDLPRPAGDLDRRTRIARAAARHGDAAAPAAPVPPTTHPVPVVDLGEVPPLDDPRARPSWQVFLWWVVQRLVVTNSLQPSSRLRARALRAFGAEIGRDVIIRPRVRVRFPWNLHVGDRCWIGEGVWISNRDLVTLGHDAVLSQETFVTTGSHDRHHMGVVTAPVVIEDGAWVTTRCIVLRGVRVGRSCIVTPNTVVDRDVPAGAVYGTPRPSVIGERFR
ncbi:acetyltransferase [Actinomycetospora chiangmaiensis]|uniref:acetyltransferase n=1 Tax=Actinomycetospora chiangmaiensis TaxID=402650 RepID=UPI001B7FD1F3|nr:acetyltransferase [Actinomycetospora chiangmaiensis]